RFRAHCGLSEEYLLSRAALRSLSPVRSQEHVRDPLVQVTFFDPTSGWTWYAVEAGLEVDEGGAIADVRFFGYVAGSFPELGYFSLRELASVRGRMGLLVERDLAWEPRPLSRVRADHGG